MSVRGKKRHIDTDTGTSLRATRTARLSKNPEHVQAGSSSADENFELRIVGAPEIIRQLESQAKQLGASSVIVLDGPTSLPASAVHAEFTENLSGGYLKGARYREGLTQMQLAELTGIPQRHLSEMENGKRAIGKMNAKRLADVLGIDYRIFL